MTQQYQCFHHGYLACPCNDRSVGLAISATKYNYSTQQLRIKAGSQWRISAPAHSLAALLAVLAMTRRDLARVTARVRRRASLAGLAAAMKALMRAGRTLSSSSHSMPISCSAVLTSVSAVAVTSRPCGGAVTPSRSGSGEWIHESQALGVW
jgi:hypothetical protein